MIKIDKRYKIKFSYAGYEQYAEFYMSKGVLIRPSLSISYVEPGKTPDVTQCKTIEEVLEKIKTIAYGGRAEIDTINGYPVFYYKKYRTRQMIKTMDSALDLFVRSQAQLFFDKELRPLLVKNKWKLATSHIGIPILVYKNEDGEWDNIKDKQKEFEFEYLCKAFLSSMNITTDFVIAGMFNRINNAEEFQLEE
jgi:hypothetical protein